MPIVVSNDQFLETCFGADWRDAHVCSFPDADQPSWFGRKVGAAGTGFDPAWNNYFTVSRFAGARRVKSDFVATYVVVVDDVGTKVAVPSKWPLPSWALETSPGNTQWGYILETPEVDAGRVNALISGMISALGDTDPGMAGVTRYMRLPVGRNTKSKLATPFDHKLNRWYPDLKHTLEDLARAAGVILPDPGTPGGTGATATSRTGEDDPAGDFGYERLSAWGMVTGDASDGVGWEIDCPWIDEHSDRPHSGAAYWVGGKFKCHHGSCAARGWRQLGDYVMGRHRADMARDLGPEVAAAWVAPGELGRVAGFADPRIATDAPPATAPALGSGAGAAPAINYGIGFAADFFREFIFVGPEDKYFSTRTYKLLVRTAVSASWNARLASEGALPALRGGTLMSPATWFHDETNTSRARNADGLIYWPGRPPYYAEDERAWINTWVEPEIPPGLVSDADVEAWLRLVQHVIGVEGPEAVECALDWMALVVGAPGVKPGWHLLLQSGQGLGKDMMFKPLKAGVGLDNWTDIDAHTLSGGFNDFSEKRFVVINEFKSTTVGTATGHDQYNTLKSLTENTNEWKSVNKKFMRPFLARNVTAFGITANNEDALSMDEDDRRFMVVMAGGVQPWPGHEYGALAAWLDDRGSGLVARWLVQRWAAVCADAGRRAALDGHAPFTAGKLTMTRNTEDPVKGFMREQIEGGAWPDLMTAEDIAGRLLDASRAGTRGGPAAVAPHRWARMLRTLGGAKVYAGAQVTLKNGQRHRIWAVREPARFSRMGQDHLAEAYKSSALRSFTSVEDNNVVGIVGSDTPRDF